MKKNPTFGILISLALAFLIGTIANIYFIFNPSNYVSPGFDPNSLWDWSIILSQTLVVIYLLFVAQKVKNKYAKLFWLIAYGLK